MSESPPDEPIWRRIRRHVADLEAVHVDTHLEGPASLRIHSGHYLLQGDIETRIDAALLRPEHRFVRDQHRLDLDTSALVRRQWGALFRQWARLDEALEEEDAE